MLAKKLSDMMPAAAHSHGDGCACGAHGDAAANNHMAQHRHEETTRLGMAIGGGILVLNSYIAHQFFPTRFDPFAVELSAVLGALILAVPIWWSAIKDLVQGKIYMNELVATAPAVR